ncbi:MAG: caspase family protein [Saprospiraceae bacterium]|nr:caspase family protein [Saprospiraceae bacterium]MCF8251539.1 caspase family protein [Saprospiraceae bacterium]MCF8280869.1 caspase family protein [Bacteroidales bacterium]MCF8310951.1 caspase family protein [Saprospiraceae bacterium]MCF8439713.1 caspase family protein [Saprospiraceae bacterium]
MKTVLALFVLLTNFSLCAQIIDLGNVTTRAVVIGISNYQDPGIPDLRFADKDAKAFASFLRSPPGGDVSSDHLRLLTNE